MKNQNLFSKFCTFFLLMSFGLPVDHFASSDPALTAGFLTFGGYVAASSTGATFEVNSTQDTPDADPADGVCADASGRCSLRAAIMQANFSPDADTIDLPAGVYQLTRAGNDDNALVGDLDILADLVIQGAGPERTIVDGNGGVTGDRVFQVLNSVENVRANGIHLTIQDSQATENSANEGGAFYLESISDGLIERTEVYSNTATAYGGGISNTTSNGSPYSLVTLQDSSLHDNHATYNGGAIDDYLPLVLSRTILENNSAGTYGGGIMIYQTYVPSTIDILQSTLSENKGQYGGGIFYNDFFGNPSKMMVQNSTLSGNVASHQGGGIYAIGQARISLLNTTIAGNEAYRRIPQHYPAFGGGLVITSTAIITAQNTLIGDNIFTNGVIIPTPDDCYGALDSLGNNLITSTNNCEIYGTTYGNISGQDPLLGPLQFASFQTTPGLVG